MSDLAALHAAVLQDPELWPQLEGLSEDAFVAQALATAQDLGLSVSAEDVQDALRRGRRAWIERWL